MHKNSQKRFYDPGITSFITVKTEENFPYFDDNVGEDSDPRLLCELWIEELRLCKKIKKFDVYAFCLLKDHFHLLLRCGEKYNISEVMHFLKRHFSRNANIIFGYTDDIRPRDDISEGEVGQPRLPKHHLAFKTFPSPS